MTFKKLNSKTIDHRFDFENLEICREFLNNLYIGETRVKEIELQNGSKVKMEDIPEDQIIQRANELRVAIKG